MKETAIVVKTAGKIAVVRVEKRPECDGCKACAFRNGKSTVKVRAYNRAGAKAGDRVSVACEKDNRALASFIVYIVPVLLAGAGVAVGAAALRSELWAALLCLAGAALGFCAVFALDKLLARTRGFGMEVTEILHNTEQSPADAGEKIASQEENDNGTGV